MKWRGEVNRNYTMTAITTSGYDLTQLHYEKKTEIGLQQSVKSEDPHRQFMLYIQL